jgi:hypothetical protein
VRKREREREEKEKEKEKGGERAAGPAINGSLGARRLMAAWQVLSVASPS